ncbi:MAG: ABC transporter ATP-binding protein [Kaiparowitsia implicata GSE-PSE-MK54-09C]|jgi:ABC-type Fe3+/spermidine/putrescine transport system ATPase subunit|nr:ABC transporter ATP-binding protein [Kaiparowitsia implicata GSE-PSE-MK54-09C]
MSETAYFSMQNLTKQFRGTAAVQDLWLDVQAGERIALLGPSGCGKSTTLQLIAGILRPDRGQIWLNGRSLNRVPTERREIALVLQKGLLFPHLSVGENVAFGLRMRGVSRAEQVERAIAMLDQVQLSGFENRKPSELSGGQAQRVALARSLVIQPKVLLLDEPLSALDASLRGDMQELILRLQAETGVTLLVVTHDQSESAVMAHRIALMFDGRLRQVDTPEALYQNPVDESVARFFGGVNFFAADAQQHRLTLAEGERLITHYPHHGTVHITIRPEHIHVMADRVCGANLLPATLIHSRFTGTQRHLTLRTSAGLQLQAWVPPSQQFAVGQSVFAHLPPEALWVFPGSATAAAPSPMAQV